MISPPAVKIIMLKFQDILRERASIAVGFSLQKNGKYV